MAHAQQVTSVCAIMATWAMIAAFPIAMACQEITLLRVIMEMVPVLPWTLAHVMQIILARNVKRPCALIFPVPLQTLALVMALASRPILARANQAIMESIANIIPAMDIEVIMVLLATEKDGVLPPIHVPAIRAICLQTVLLPCATACLLQIQHLVKHWPAPIASVLTITFVLAEMAMLALLVMYQCVMASHRTMIVFAHCAMVHVQPKIRAHVYQDTPVAIVNK